MVKFNPFRPGSVISPGMFVGRSEEINAIKQALIQTREGNPQHFIIEGERGIGKSSLCLLVDYLAKGDIPFDEKTRLSFVVVNVEFQENMSHDDLVDCLLVELKRVISDRQPLIENCKKAWEFLSRFQAAGIKFDNQKRGDVDQRRLDELTDVLVNLLEEAAGAIEGVLLLIDEADRPHSDAHLGQLCKLLTERLARRRCDNVCIGLSGLPGLLTKLKDSHESSLRVFKVFRLEPLEHQERGLVIDRGMEEANRKSDTTITISDSARGMIGDLSEGYPHFLQEFASCSFAHDSDDTIDAADVMQGAFNEHGALDQLGKKYFADLYIDQIGSEDYRRVLVAMTEEMDDWTSRGTIIERSKVKEKTVDNALKALTKRKIILLNPAVRGEYRLPTKSFAVWIRAREEGKSTQRAAS